MVTNADYVLIFITEDAVNSKAMEEELTWIRNKENDLGKDILLPVITDSSLLQSGYLSELKDRNYILFNRRGAGADADYVALVMEILAKLSVRLVKEMERPATEREVQLFGPAGTEPVSVDDIKMARVIADLVLNTNRRNPRKYEDVINTLSNQGINNAEDVRNTVKSLTNKNILGGVYYVWDGIFEGFDHYKLKALQAVEDKRRIAQRAVDQIDKDDIVIIDSGSTCNEVARELVRHISDGMLSGLDVVVCSASAATPFLDNLEYSDHDIDRKVKLHIRGGNVQLRNNAIVRGNALIDYTDISAISDDIRKGRKVKSFIGCNYFDEHGVFYSVESHEADNKKQIMIPSDKVFILAASGKCLTNSEAEPFKFAEAAHRNNITLIIGGYIDDAKREQIESTGVTVLMTNK